MNRRAFTLIEVLVVIGILGLLLGLLAPSLSKARGQARLTSCATNLHQVGVAMIAYMQDNRDRMPHVSMMPSIGPAPVSGDKSIYLAEVLKRHLKSPQALSCPDDRPGKTERLAPNVGLSFFQSERSSYEYRFRLAGLTPTEFGANAGGHGWHHRHDPGTNLPPNTVWFARDYDNFHGKAGQIGARRYVYIDGHVSDYEN